MKKIILIFAATALFLVTAHATSIVFDTFPSNTYNLNLGDDVGTAPTFIEEAAQFTAGVSGNLANVYLGLTYRGHFGSPQVLDVYLYGDASGSPDNASQNFLGVVGPPTAEFGTSNNSIFSFAVAGTVPVTSGTTYWLVLKPGGVTGDDVWNNSSPAVSGSVNFSLDDSTWQFNNAVLPAFRLTASSGSSVPDSGSTILLMLGALAPLVVLQRKFIRRPAIQ